MGRAVAPRAALALLALVAVSAACAPGVRQAQRLTGGHLLTSEGTSQSTVFLAPLDTGYLVVDLGWTGAAEELVRVLESVGATPSDVRAVLLTHAHRDHIAAWPVVADAPFYMGAAEVDLFLGRASPGGPVDGLAHQVRPAPRPKPGEVEIRPLPGDTVLVIGGDTIRTFEVPGHTPGSTAYLFRGVLFVGDALTTSAKGEIGPALSMFTGDPALARESVERLWNRVDGLVGVRLVCTAHAHCEPYDDVREDWNQSPPDPS
ncbi:MAG TPA: MBL fold metallo-hydrolase [Longimicrobiales bacterium]|nr:MBL fold metallo-hydrolase [Longimicrobiales bacterium]